MDRTCVVTGAASGIGAATAERLGRDGVRVIACDLHDADVIADLATPEGRAALVDRVAAASGGRIDAIVANAGGGPAETSLQLNFFGAVATLEGLRPLMAASPSPRAVAVSSISSLRPPCRDRRACLALRRTGRHRRGLRAYRAGELGGGSSDLVPGRGPALARPLWRGQAGAEPLVPPDRDRRRSGPGLASR